MKAEHVRNLNFYFIHEMTSEQAFLEIASKKLYKKISIPIDELEKNPINHIFYSEDSIELVHEYNVETPGTRD